jgi:hypothetical protein
MGGALRFPLILALAWPEPVAQDGGHLAEPRDRLVGLRCDGHGPKRVPARESTATSFLQLSTAARLASSTSSITMNPQLCTRIRG